MLTGVVYFERILLIVLLSIRTADGLTPLHVSCMWNRSWSLRLLLRSGGDPKICDNEGEDAFSYAKSREVYIILRQASKLNSNNGKICQKLMLAKQLLFKVHPNYPVAMQL